jgi:hypothetical protein
MNSSLDQSLENGHQKEAAITATNKARNGMEYMI